MIRMKVRTASSIIRNGVRVLLCFTIAAICGLCAASLPAQTAKNPQPAAPTPAEATRKDLLAQFNESLQELTARVSPSIVQVQVTGYRALNDKNDTDASTIGIAPTLDLALLKIEQKDLPAMAFADYTQLKKGQLVLAFGSPEGLE